MAGGAPTGSSLGPASRTISRLWDQQHVAKVDVESGSNHTPLFNLQQIARGEVDLALSENDLLIPSDSGGLHVRTVIPIYPQILFIIAHDTINAGSLEELVRGRRVVLGPARSGTAILMRRLLESRGIDSTKYHPIYAEYKDRILSDTVDICCALTGFNNPTIMEMLTQRHGKLFSLDNYELAGRGSSVDGFCLNYRGARPFIIPKSSYGAAPVQPALTVAVDAVLLARDSLDPYLVHDLVKSLIDNQQSLSQQDPLFSAMSEEFDQRLLAYPLHEGVMMYLERNQPSFLERYTDVIGLAFSVLVALAGGVSAFIRWNGQRKKNRVDTFYTQVMTIERAIPDFVSLDECDSATQRLLDLRSRAFEQLIEEKLAANESFRILTSIISDALAAIAQRRSRLERSMVE